MADDGSPAPRSVAFHQGTVDAVAAYVEHLRDDFVSTTEPVKKVARLIREQFALRAGADDRAPARQLETVAIAGERMERPIYEFVRACDRLLADEQEKPNPDNALIAVLCDAVRLTRELEAMARRPL